MLILKKRGGVSPRSSSNTYFRLSESLAAKGDYEVAVLSLSLQQKIPPSTFMVTQHRRLIHSDALALFIVIAHHRDRKFIQTARRKGTHGQFLPQNTLNLLLSDRHFPAQNHRSVTAARCCRDQGGQFLPTANPSKHVLLRQRK